MVDSMNNVDPPVVTPEPPVKQGFLSTTNGKIIVGAIAFVLVLVILGVIAFVFLVPMLFNQGANQGVTIVKKSTGTVSKPATATASAAPITNPPEKPVSNTFTFRNVFAPTVKPVYPTTASSTTSSTSGTSSSSSSSSSSIPTEKNTLFLMSISTVNGEKQAVFAWNGVLYTVTDGEQVDSSPWKVISIGSDSVLMLFGDTQITLTLGQGVNK